MIEIQNLSKAFKKVSVIDQLNHTFSAGERIALIGQNGAGKTTLLRCILGLYKYEGKIEVLNMEPRKQRKEILKHIGFVPQLPPPIKMTVQEMLTFFSELTNTPKETFIEIAEKLGLNVGTNLKKPFMKLSGGMKQKLLVAFALGKNPDILLMDEPAANLDPAARVILFEYLQKFNPNALMIISSHRIDEVENLVNKVVEMDMGQIIVDKVI